LNNLTFSDQSLERTEESAQIQDLSAIREIDQSLTVVFSLQEATKNHRLYQLFCLDEEQEITHFAKLVQTDNFFGPILLFEFFI
jgi:hypothetical protein